MTREGQLLANQLTMLSELGEIKGIVKGHESRIDKLESAAKSAVTYKAAGLITGVVTGVGGAVTIVTRLLGVW